MTRFEREITGALGAFWQMDARKRVDDVLAEYANGEITVRDGVAYNCIGRVVVRDVAEVMEYAGIAFDREATEAARDAEASAFLRSYRPTVTEEDLVEMRAAFGTGTNVVDVLSGDVYEL